MALYHISAYVNHDLGYTLHDSMYELPKPNLAESWLPRVREVIHDVVTVETGRTFPISAVTIISISPL